MLIKWIIALITIASYLLMPLPLFAASDITVSFEVIAVSPVGATVRATIHNLTSLDIEKSINIVLSDMSKAVKTVKVESITIETYEVDVPVYEERPLTLAEIDAIKESPEYTKDFEIPKTTLDVAYYDKVVKQREVKTLKADYSDAGKAMAVTSQVIKNSTAIIDFTVTTGVSWNGDKFINAGTLALMIDGREYKDLTNSSWWNASWEHRIKLTIDNTASAENLVNFPMMVKLVNGVNFTYADAQADLGDLRFIDADGTTVCDYEVELAGATSYVWVEVPQINLGVNTDYVYMYYGNPTVANGWNITGTWNAGYVAVYHMNDATTSTILDSTSNNYDGAKKAANEPIQNAGYLGYGQSFDGIDDYIIFSDNAALNPANLTVEAIVQWAQVSNDYDLIVGKRQDPASSGWGLHQDNGTDQLSLWINDGGDSVNAPSGALAQNAWHIEQGTFSPTDIKLYSDTVLGTGVQDSLAQSTRPLLMGKELGHNREWKGWLDEVRLSNVARSADWLEATYLSNTNVFITYAAADDMVQAPTNFTVTQTGADEVTLDWTAGTDATHTVIRGKDGGYPTSITDGYEVYNGVGITTTLTGLDINRMGYYYRAWGYNDTYLVYSVGYAQDFLGGDTMVYLLLGIVAAGLTVAMFTTRNSLLGFPSAIFWAILGAYAYTQSSVAWGDWQYYLFFASAFGMTIFTALAAYSLREKRDSLGDRSVERNDNKEEAPSAAFEDIVKEPHDSAFDMGENTPSRTTQRIRNRLEHNKELRRERADLRRER